MPQRPPNEHALRKFAQLLEESRCKIVSEWMDAVRADPQIPDADHLTLAALEDHFPEMLGELTAGLREPDTLLDGDTLRTANDHGKSRWRQGYRLDEVLRELARIREILLRHVRNFCSERDFQALRDVADERVRSFFDMMVAHSARQFMREQEAELSLRSQQLEHAYDQVRSATEKFRSVAESRLRLLRGVSHELRNALNAVGLGASDLLHESDGGKRSPLVSGLTQRASYLQRVIDRLHQFSNILAGETELQMDLLEMEKFLRDLETTHRPGAESKGLEWQCSHTSEIAMVKIDANKLRHIADILLSNAIEYTDEGRIEVSTTCGKEGRWSFHVIDTGTGIHEADVARLFQEFYRSNRSTHRGIGLGLIIAQHLARLMNGEITFKAGAEGGSLFEVNLPTDLSARAA